MTDSRYAIKVDGEEIDHADSFAEARKNRDTIIYGGIGTEDNTTIVRRSTDYMGYELGGGKAFWHEIELQLEDLGHAKSAKDVLTILAAPGHNSPAFFAGSGGDGSPIWHLDEAGWSTIWWRADYHWALRAPDGSAITYVEGDIFEGDRP